MKYFKKIILPLLVVLLVAGYLYWLLYWRYFQTTDNAYTQNDITNISARISAQVMHSFIQDNREVRQGQLLAILDDRAYKVAVLKAEADVAQMEAALANARASYEMQKSTINEYNDSLRSEQASEKYAHQQMLRYRQLSANRYVSAGDMDNADSTYNVEAAKVAQAQSSLQTQKAKLPVLQTAIEQAEADLKQAQASLEAAKLELTYTRITAPIDGVIGNRSLQVGMLLQAGQTIASIVADQRPWVIANFKETQKGDMKAGQPVEITIDSYPGQVFHGHIDSLSPATGSIFALLPADNATGNFTKVVQRVPVKIVFDTPVNIASGLSSEITVDTRR
ncbi:HlyD family secretion protein [Prodigiosinella confusarubida]|uniref:HlyD family secretion protein n=1 Tax=Serratia sp. (strain ATCC 39006) TaxID=104623 RepID=A0A2I5TML6_SERS3|nr:HlyD family secretion protein [Serratia sp. ATCC 39006]AUH01474.1 HlyD family secretion protein [Serratia sp. ATCC 39006]AUH05796.1 HlyD family secretion protein [Serratia sp. ATCC 39006]